MFQSTIEAGSDRTFPRSHVLMTATLMTPHGAVSVRIRDISVVGAQVWAETPVESDCDAILKRGGFFVAARVVRSGGERTAGLQFYRRLSDEEFASAFHRSDRANAAA